MSTAIMKALIALSTIVVTTLPGQAPAQYDAALARRYFLERNMSPATLAERHLIERNMRADLAERYLVEEYAPWQRSGWHCAMTGEFYIGNACQRLSGGPDDMLRRDR